jgi:subtilisin family serine protease
MNMRLPIAKFTYCTILYLSLASTLCAQDVPKNWPLLDPSTDHMLGISLQKAYDYLSSKHKKSTPIVVAVIDSGIDTTHEDLKNILWTNAKEIAGNGIDDDNNGYIDDVHGWNFLGNKNGQSVKRAPDERSRIYHKYKSKFLSPTLDTNTLITADKALYATWKKTDAELNFSDEEKEQLKYVEMLSNAFKKHDKIIRQEMNTASYNRETLTAFIPSSVLGKEAKLGMLSLHRLMQLDKEELNTYTIAQLEEYIEGKTVAFSSKEKLPNDERTLIVRDNYYNFADAFYGNNDIMGPTPNHGTHVSGIIAAARNNGVGIDGVSDAVKIMMIRVVPDGDEYDKDVALAIKYAVNNGAKIINMSFGKAYSPEKYWVDSAVRYAEQKDVLLVHSAGNESYNLDSITVFPNAYLAAWKKNASNFITIGASSDTLITDNSIAAEFSNYGKQNVDLFAPGVKIYSTLPGGNVYGNQDGTSMASPIVTGVAAILRTYYPSLSAQQVKTILEKTVYIPAATAPSLLPGNSSITKPFSTLSKTGGIVNAYNAVVLANSMVNK